MQKEKQRANSYFLICLTQRLKKQASLLKLLKEHYSTMLLIYPLHFLYSLEFFHGQCLKEFQRPSLMAKKLKLQLVTVTDRQNNKEQREEILRNYGILQESEMSHKNTGSITCVALISKRFLQTSTPSNSLTET